MGRVGVGVRGLLGGPAVLLVRVPGSAWCSGCDVEMLAAVERVDELFGPWPAGCDAEPGLSAAARDLARGVEQGVARPGSVSIRFAARTASMHRRATRTTSPGLRADASPW